MRPLSRRGRPVLSGPCGPSDRRTLQRATPTKSCIHTWVLESHSTDMCFVGMLAEILTAMYVIFEGSPTEHISYRHDRTHPSSLYPRKSARPLAERTATLIPIRTSRPSSTFPPPRTQGSMPSTHPSNPPHSSPPPQTSSVSQSTPQKPNSQTDNPSPPLSL